MAWYVYVNVNHVHLQNWSAPSCYLTTAVLNDCYSEVTACTALAYSCFHNTYGCYGHTHWRYQLQLLLYKTIELIQPINRVYIIPLVINSLRGGDTHMHAYRHLWTEAILRNQTYADSIFVSWLLWILLVKCLNISGQAWVICNWSSEMLNLLCTEGYNKPFGGKQ